jgi:hypothetical protein
MFTKQIIGDVPAIITSSTRYPFELYYISNSSSIKNKYAFIKSFHQDDNEQMSWANDKFKKVIQNTLNLGNGFAIKQGITMDLLNKSPSKSQIKRKPNWLIS